MEIRKRISRPLLSGLGAAFLFIILSLLLFVMVYGDKPYEERIAKKTLTRILRAVSEQDLEALKEMFSPAALEQAPELDANIEKLFALLQGDIQLSEERRGLSVHEHIEFLKYNQQIRAGYILITEQGTYEIHFALWVKEQARPDMRGLWSIQIADSSLIHNAEGFRFLPPEKVVGVYIYEDT